MMPVYTFVRRRADGRHWVILRDGDDVGWIREGEGKDGRCVAVLAGYPESRREAHGPDRALELAVMAVEPMASIVTVEQTEGEPKKGRKR